MNPSKQKGTAAESAVAAYMVANGWPHCERRALSGRFDKGDLVGMPGLVVEVKGGTAAETASPGLIARWMAETLTETQNAQADYGLLVCKRAGVGPARAGEWFAYLRADDFLSLHGHHVSHGTWPLRMTLAEAVGVLRAAGYGDPVVQDGAA